MCRLTLTDPAMASAKNWIGLSLNASTSPYCRQPSSVAATVKPETMDEWP